MLRPADLELIQRDGELPGLATVLDPQLLVSKLRPLLGLGEHCTGKISYLRYKPQTNCLVSCELDNGNTRMTFSAKAHRRSEWETRRTAHLRRCCHQRASAFPPVVDDLAITVSLFPEDRVLRSLGRLCGLDSRHQLLAQVLPNRQDLWNASICTLAYKPERRYVGQVVVSGKPAAVIKLYSSTGYEVSRRTSKAFKSRSVLRVAQRLGRSTRHRAIAFEWLKGELLDDVIREQGETAAVGRAADALAELHDRRCNRLRARTRNSMAQSVWSLADYIGFVCPQLDAFAQELGRHLADRILAQSEIQRPLHGDFYAKQVVLPTQGVALLDFDAAVQGDPAEDLGNLAAHLENEALRGALTSARSDAARDAFFTAYEQVTGDREVLSRVGLRTAVSLFLLAPHPFRNREQEWPDRIAAILHRVEELAKHDRRSGRCTVRMERTG